MKKIIILVFIIVTTSLLSFVFADTEGTNSTSSTVEKKTVTLSIEKMTCNMCHTTVRKAMEKVEGVQSAVVDYNNRTATVIYDPSKTNIETIALASTNAGYPAKQKCESDIKNC
jgi:periplasmic mercuric ion binding protein